MHPRGGALQWSSRQKRSLGPLRRAHPASGAQWNVQVVRAKVTSKCLWHACKALSLGLLLMLLGASMATIGYYADQLSEGSEIRGNSTVRVKNESRGFHLSNLSYAGPIVMGFGGFIVVAACVMTFEARDSAAKVVPARFKLSAARQTARSVPVTDGSRRSAACQTGGRWEQHLGLFRSSPRSSRRDAGDRKALTAAFVHFSKALGSSGEKRSPMSTRDMQVGTPMARRMPRSGSVPNLAESRGSGSTMTGAGGVTGSGIGLGTISPNPLPRPLPRLSPRGVQRQGCALLNPGLLQRHALSVDETMPYLSRKSQESLSGSQGSMVLDLHQQSTGETSVLGITTLKVRDRSRRSDTARRHVLSRQRPIDREDLNSPRLGVKRRNSNASECSRGRRRASSHLGLGRASSTDSKCSLLYPIEQQRSLNISIVEINEVSHDNDNGNLKPENLQPVTRIKRASDRSIEVLKSNSCDGNRKSRKPFNERNLTVSQSFSGKGTVRSDFVIEHLKAQLSSETHIESNEEICTSELNITESVAETGKVEVPPETHPTEELIIDKNLEEIEIDIERNDL